MARGGHGEDASLNVQTLYLYKKMRERRQKEGGQRENNLFVMVCTCPTAGRPPLSPSSPLLRLSGQSCTFRNVGKRKTRRAHPSLVTHRCLQGWERKRRRRSLAHMITFSVDHVLPQHESPEGNEQMHFETKQSPRTDLREWECIY